MTYAAIAIGANTAVVFPTVTGGSPASDGTYYYKTFTSTNNFVISNGPLPVEYLVVAGGGGGNFGGGGGGAGGVRLGNATLSSGTYVATVGGGSSGVSSGNLSSFNSLISAGGGIGGGNGGSAGSPGEPLPDHLN